MKKFHLNNIELNQKATARLLTLNGNGLIMRELVERLLENFLISDSNYNQTIKLLEEIRLQKKG